MDEVRQEIEAARFLGAKSGWCINELLSDEVHEAEARRRIAERWFRDHRQATREAQRRRTATSLAAPPSTSGDA